MGCLVGRLVATDDRSVCAAGPWAWAWPQNDRAGSGKLTKSLNQIGPSAAFCVVRQTPIMTVPGALPAVLIVGDAGVGKAYIAERLFPGAAADGRVTIVTKYYKADVAVRVVHSTEHVDESVCAMCEAFVAVFDVNDASSLASLRPWMEKVDAQINVCVANDPAGSGSREARSVGVQFADDNNLEFVETPWNSRLSPDGPTGDAEGLDRLLEIMQCHAWPGLQRTDTDARLSRSPRPCPGANLDPASEVSHDDLDRVFEMVRHVRDRASTLPDSERRKAAEDAVLELMRAFGVDGDGSDGDSP
ncbi:Uncharacterized protein PBTT_05245 [Plasmodiophora brassicae]|uniref:Uncharacterized protein n=1 Tax=Plasmodiophora brassicae TaxID=37360 RepID=A0A3P3YCM1_PLABS|nr:unnamed protein product [Plasmodiophora brassicae]